MLLIGFIWVFVGMAAAMLARPLVGGRWEDSGPAAMMTASMGAFVGGSLAVLMVDGPNGFGPPLAEATVGIIGSLVGGAIGFFGYIFDAKRAATAVS
jgi:uncharacterized membrane protein YeaQ/YmgE (transglycosylase-associated protein family)